MYLLAERLLPPLFCYLLFACLNIHYAKGDEKLMKAVVMNTLGNPEVLQVEEIPIPTISTKQVLVKVKAAGINRVDIYTRRGTSYRKANLPMVLGKEIAGIVEAVDPSVESFAVGDRVFCGTDYGGYAEYAVANETTCFALPEKASFSEGAALYITYFVAYRALIVKGTLTADDVLLIHGASGSLGTAAMQIAKSVGARVVVTIKGHVLDDLMKEAGADHITYHEPSSDQYLEDSLKTLNATGFDVVLDVLRFLNLHRDKKFLNIGGRIVVMGKRVTDSIGDMLFRPGQGSLFYVSFTKYDQADQLGAIDFITKGIEKGTIKPVICQEYKLEDAARAHRDLSQSRVDKGKCVFVL